MSPGCPARADRRRPAHVDRPVFGVDVYREGDGEAGDLLPQRAVGVDGHYPELRLCKGHASKSKWSGAWGPAKCAMMAALSWAAGLVLPSHGRTKSA